MEEGDSEDEEPLEDKRIVIEEEEEDEFYTKPWWECMDDEIVGKERISKVKFAAVGVQWLERQRSRKENNFRVAMLCGSAGEGVAEQPTLSDSGTNIHVISYKTAQELHRCGFRYHSVKEGEPRQSVMFGKKSAKEPIIGHMYGEGLIGKVAVVKTVAANLISVSDLTQRGFEVQYSKHKVEVIKQGSDKVLFVGPYDPSTKLFHLDIVHLMLTPEPGKGGGGEGTGASSSSSARNKEKEGPPGDDSGEENEAFAGGAQERPKVKVRFKARAIRKAIYLHRNCRHVPFSTMADNVECGAWTGLDPEITPALLRELAARRACVVCAVNRWNQDHREGTGANEYEVGEAFAFDYLGKFSPPSRNGETGEFLFTDLGSGLTRRYGEKGDKTKVEDAVKMWCTFMLSHGHVAKWGRHDSGSVETGAAFKTALAKMKIGNIDNPVSTIATPPGIPEKNIERVVQTHKQDIAAILSSSPTLEASDWDIASEHACTLRSTTVSAASRKHGDGRKTPFELVTGRPPRMEVFEQYGLGDVGVCKRAAANAPGYGASKNEVVQIVAIEVDDAKGVIVERLGTRSRVRRGDFRKVHLIATEPSEEAQLGRTARFTDDLEKGTITFVVEGGENVSIKSLRQIAEQEVRLADQREQEEIDSIAQRVRESRAQRERVEDQEQEEKEQREEQEEEEQKEQADDDQELFEPTYWGPNVAFWAAYIAQVGMPSKEYASKVHQFTLSTGVELEMEDGDTEEQEEGQVEQEEDVTTMEEETAQGGPSAFAAKRRVVRDMSNPTKRQLINNEVWADSWRPSMEKERRGIAKTSHVVSKEYALRFGVTPHVTARTTKRDGTLKTRFAIDGSFEIRRGKFPDRDVLYSPAMDEELLRLSMQCTATLGMEMGKSDVEQCFTHNPMATARYPRKIIVYMDEYESGVSGGEYREFDSVSYGTADASSEWYINLKREMVDMGFAVSVHHPCLFVKGTPATEDLIMVATATDDFLRMNLATEKARAAMAEFKKQLDERWPMVHTDDIDEVIGVAIEWGQHGELRCTQPAEMKKIRAAFFGTEPVPEVMVPLHPDIDPAGGESEGPFEEYDLETEADAEERGTSYRSLLGKLGYIRVTRIDALYALSVLAERAHRPTRRDRQGLFWLAAYLLTSERLPLTFHPGGPEAVTETGVLKWSLFGDGSWGTRRGSYSCIAQMVVHGDLRTEEQRLAKPFTGPVVARTGKEKGPPSDSASAAELHATVAVIKSGMVIRGMSEEIAGVAVPHSLERMPEEGGGSSPLGLSPPSALLTDNLSNQRALNTESAKKPKGMKQYSRELAFAKFHAEEGSVEIIAVPAGQQRANPMTKAIRSASVHWREAEWLMGSSFEVRLKQKMAEERGRSKRSLRPEVMTVAGFAGFGNGQQDRQWAESSTDRRETGKRSKEEEKETVARNTRANAAPRDSWTSRLRSDLIKRRKELAEEKKKNKSIRKRERPNHGNGNGFAADWNTYEELAELIFRPREWMIPPRQTSCAAREEDAPSDEEARRKRCKREQDADQGVVEVAQQSRKRGREQEQEKAEGGSIVKEKKQRRSHKRGGSQRNFHRGPTPPGSGRDATTVGRAQQSEREPSTRGPTPLGSGRDATTVGRAEKKKEKKAAVLLISGEDCYL